MVDDRVSGVESCALPIFAPLSTSCDVSCPVAARIVSSVTVPAVLPPVTTGASLVPVMVMVTGWNEDGRGSWGGRGLVSAGASSLKKKHLKFKALAVKLHS